jgi:FkbM family methyltransferase
MSIVSYAQNFEDVMLWRALGHIEHGLYIDIGAQDPVVDSVSLAFHEHGWRGIHVEPTPHYAELLRQQRPGDKIIQSAVGSKKRILPFFEIPHTGISTADATIADQHRERGFDVHEISVPCITLATVFKECQAHEIHWLKIDVEGLEEQVLRSWGAAKARPWIVVVESTLPLTQIESHESWQALLVSRNYSPVYFDGLNRYYVSNAHPELKPAFAVPPNVFDAFKLNGTASSTLHQLIETRHQSETSQALEQHTRQRQDLQDEIERLSAGVATLGAAQEKNENARATWERELAAAVLSATVQAEAEKVTLALEHEHHEHALHAEHTKQEAALTQRLQRLENERSALEQEYASRERTLIEQAKGGRERIAALQQTQAQRESQAQALEENIRALQAQAAQRQSALEAQVKIAQQQIRNEQATRAKRAQNAAARLLAIYRQATRQKKELVDAYIAEKSQLQRSYAEQECLFKAQLESSGLELVRLQRLVESLKEQHAEAEKQSRAQLETAEKLHAQRALELTGLMLESQQKSARDNAEQARNFLLQERVLQRQHSDQQGLLTGELKAAQSEIVRLLKYQADRETRHAALKDELKAQSDSALANHVTRERALSAQLLSSQQQAEKKKEEQALKYLEEERELRLQLARLADSSNTEIQRLSTDLSERERIWEANKNSLSNDVEAMRSEAHAIKHSSDQAEQQHRITLSAEQAERTRLIEAWSALEAQLRNEVVFLENSASLRLRHALEEVKRNLAATQANFTWRATKPLRKLASLLNFRQSLHLTPGENAQSFGSFEQVQPLPTFPALAEPTPSTATPTQSEHPMPISDHSNQSTPVSIALTLPELLARYDQDFVECAYRTLLGRAPDPEGLSYYLGRIRTGVPKMRTVLQLSESPEGKGYAPKLSGLDNALVQFRRSERPIFGWFIRAVRQRKDTYSTEFRLRAFENQLWLLNNSATNRFDRLENSLEALHQSLLQQSQSIVLDLGGIPKDTVARNISASAQPDRQEQLSHLTPQARQIYENLKSAIFSHSRNNQ